MTTFRLYGTLRGHTWAGYEATMDVDRAFVVGKNWCGLKSALRTLATSGDFQECRLVENLLIKRTTERGNMMRTWFHHLDFDE